MTHVTKSATGDIGQVLIPIARASIAKALSKPYGEINEGFPWLHEKGASFVTLTPVSYTHLDVYKRQVTQCALKLDGAIAVVDAV